MLRATHCNLELHPSTLDVYVLHTSAKFEVCAAILSSVVTHFLSEHYAGLILIAKSWYRWGVVRERHDRVMHLMFVQSGLRDVIAFSSLWLLCIYNCAS